MRDYTTENKHERMKCSRLLAFKLRGLIFAWTKMKPLLGGVAGNTSFGCLWHLGKSVEGKHALSRQAKQAILGGHSMECPSWLGSRSWRSQVLAKPRAKAWMSQGAVASDSTQAWLSQANLSNPRAEATCFSQVDGCSAHIEKETQLSGVCYARHGSTAMTA